MHAHVSTKPACACTHACVNKAGVCLHTCMCQQSRACANARACVNKAGMCLHHACVNKAVHVLTHVHVSTKQACACTRACVNKAGMCLHHACVNKTEEGSTGSVPRLVRKCARVRAGWALFFVESTHQECGAIPFGRTRSARAFNVSRKDSDALDAIPLMHVHVHV